MKIISIINTVGLIYDDRLIKETQSLLESGVDVQIVAFERKNRKETGTYKNVPFTTLRLYTRKYFPKPKQFLNLKAIEFLLKTFLVLFKNRGKVVWLHNIEMCGGVAVAVLLLKSGYLKGVIWDQHELPNESLIQNKIFKPLFSWICKNCDFVISANNARADFLIKHFPQLKSNMVTINNFPTEEIISSPKRKLPEPITNWLNGREYILFQGSAWPIRKIYECAHAVKEINTIPLLIVGPISEEVKTRLQSIFGTSYETLVYAIGMVPQNDLYIYIDNCLLSLIFYAQTNSNNWLCEPNRFYQAICRKKPVVCGANPPMRSIINEYSCGISISNDGSNMASIKDGINFVLENYQDMLGNTCKVHNQLTWDANQDAFKRILKFYGLKNEPVALCATV